MTTDLISFWYYFSQLVHVRNHLKLCNKLLWRKEYIQCQKLKRTKPQLHKFAYDNTVNRMNREKTGQTNQCWETMLLQGNELGATTNLSQIAQHPANASFGTSVSADRVGVVKTRGRRCVIVLLTTEQSNSSTQNSSSSCSLLPRNLWPKRAMLGKDSCCKCFVKDQEGSVSKYDTYARNDSGNQTT